MHFIWYWPARNGIRCAGIDKSCEICKQVKHDGFHQSVSHGALFAARLWEKVVVYYMLATLPVTHRSNKWVLDLTDHFTRWQDALSLSEAPAIAKGLSREVGCSHSDRGFQLEY